MKQYHIQLDEGEIGRYVLLPGDPGRVESIARQLDCPHEVVFNREFRTWAGTLEGEPVAVTSTGIGGPSAAIAVQELSRIGCDTFVRLGTCGSLQREIRAGELIIPTGSIRGGATSLAYVPVEYPAVADPDLVQILRETVRARGLKAHSGIIQCKDAYFLEETCDLPSKAAAEAQWETWRRARVLATEMESDTIFVLGTIYGLRVATLLLTLGGLFDESATDVDATNHDGLSRLIDCGIESMRRIILSDRTTKF